MEDAMKVRMRGSAPAVELRYCSRSCLLLRVLLFLLLTGSGICGQAQEIVIVGSGSSVPAPLYNRWAQEYGKRNPRIQLRYLPIGTNEGIKQISHGAGDFGAGEARLTEKERKEGDLIELPTVLIGIVPIYNLPNVHQELRLSGEVLAEIFLGEVTTWDSPSIAKLNPDLTLPSLRIQVINRPGGKGSNYVFTDFLSKVSSKFRAQIGVTASPNWPVGSPAERSSDMVDKVKSEAGSIGFAELQYAVKAKIPMAAVLNPAGKYVRATNESISAACEATEAPRWNGFSASLTNMSGADSFPISSFSWVYLRTSSSNMSRAVALRALLDWIYSDGQQFATQEGYTELPPPLLAAVKKRVKELP
jgi:phosphate transport system substrate-binding protein